MSDPPVNPHTKIAVLSGPRICRVTAAGLLSIAAAAWLVPLAGIRGPIGMAGDIASAFTAHTAVLSLVACGWWLIVRRRRLAATACVVSLVALAGILTVPRAPTSLPASAVTNDPAPVRVLFWNVSPTNTRPADAAQVLVESNADIVALAESPGWLIDALQGDTPADANPELTSAAAAIANLRARLPHLHMPDRAAGGFQVVMTRWPQHELDGLIADPRRTIANGRREMILARPDGAFAFFLYSPKSPRSLARWEGGNAGIEALGESVRTAVTPRGVPHVSAGDLNSGPAGVRARLFHRTAGLVRTKPLFTPGGSFPGAIPSRLGVAIDDVLAGPGVAARSWRMLPASGSDHRPVLVELLIPPGPSVDELEPLGTGDEKPISAATPDR